MNNGISFGLGLIIGGIGGFFAGKYYFENKANERADAEIDDMRQYYNISRDYINNNDDIASVNSIESEEEDYGVHVRHRENGPLSSDERNAIKKQRREDREKAYNKVRYNAISKPNDNEVEDPDIAEMEQIADERKETRNEKPRIISESAISDLPSYYDSRTLFYYMFDGTLVDEDDNIIDDPCHLIGDALTKYGFIDDDNDENIIYVRNYELDTVYELQKINAAFGD